MLSVFVVVYLSLTKIEVKEYQIDRELPIHENGMQFAGSESCSSCHQDIYKSHLQTPHFNTSKLISGGELDFIIESPHNSFKLGAMTIALEKEKNQYYQITRDRNGKITHKTKLDVIIGSNNKGQSYLNFEGDSLYQLQASYFNTEKILTNSPGYPNQVFKRAVKDNCIKCHVSYAKNRDPKGNSNIYNRNTIMYGIDCERCHGPSKEHVDYRLGINTEIIKDPMVLIKDLGRQAKIDICAQCHAGLRSLQIKGNPFSYLVGDTLEKYTRNFYTGKPSAELDVHGNQYGLLKSSACYKNSPSMSCTSCHNPHDNQRGNTGYFNSKCIACHNKPVEKHLTATGENFENCISCHMPISKSKSMKMSVDNQEEGVEIRSHLIGVYE